MTDLEQQAREVLRQQPPVDWNGSTFYTETAAVAAMLAFRAAQPREGALERFDAHYLAVSHRPVSAKRDALLSELEAIRSSMCRAALSTPHLPERLDREAVARIIDPKVWKLHDNAIAKAAALDGQSLGSVQAHDERDYARRCVSPSLAKADAILALLPAEPVQKMREKEAWLPIETAPREHGFMILSFNRYRSIDVICWNKNQGDAGGWDDGTYREVGEGHPFEPQFWRPLPEPPAALSEPKDQGEGDGRR